MLEDFEKCGFGIAVALVMGAAGIGRAAAPSVEEGRSHWAFQTLKAGGLPSVKDAAWPGNAIDHFILAKLEGAGLRPSPEADRATLIRRVTLDLIGLPPTPEEVAAFEKDESPQAWERLIDRLLASPHYGERWGRHWLDLARYADTSGFHNDLDRPHAWRYRDYVIRSFNDDKPYARFVAEQIAGDEVAGADEQTLIATGFCRNGPSNDDNMGKNARGPRAVSRRSARRRDLHHGRGFPRRSRSAAPAATITRPTRCRRRITTACSRSSTARRNLGLVPGAEGQGRQGNQGDPRCKVQALVERVAGRAGDARPAAGQRREHGR